MAEVVIVSSKEEAGSIAADIIARVLAASPDAVLGLATGSTPLSTYRALAALGLDLSAVRGFALDEYVGLPADHPESYRSVITREVVEPLGLTPGSCGSRRRRAAARRAPATATRPTFSRLAASTCRSSASARTGHIGFNEPGSSLASLTRVKTLTEQTRIDNARFFDSIDDVPIHCITQGLGTILRAKHLILLAFGAAKAPAVAGCARGPGLGLDSRLRRAAAPARHRHPRRGCRVAAAARRLLPLG